jgi:hypothetical protein
MKKSRLCGSTALLLLTAAITSAQTRQWLPMGEVAGADGLVERTCAYDPDGNGPRPPMLVVAGRIGGVSGALGRVVARDENGWRGISSGLVLPYSQGLDVNVLLQFDPDGEGAAQPQIIIAGRLAV